MKTNDAAFPCPETQDNVYQSGMTLREWFAGLAMQGLMSGPSVQMDAEEIAKSSVYTADALIDELNK